MLKARGVVIQLFKSHGLTSKSMREYRKISKATIILQKYFRRKTAQRQQTLYTRLRSALRSTIAWEYFILDYCTLQKLLNAALRPNVLMKKQHKNLSEPVKQEYGLNLFGRDAIEDKTIQESYNSIFFNQDPEWRQFALLTNTDSEVYATLSDHLYGRPHWRDQAIVATVSKATPGIFNSCLLGTWSGQHVDLKVSKKQYVIMEQCGSSVVMAARS